MAEQASYSANNGRNSGQNNVGIGILSIILIILILCLAALALTYCGSDTADIPGEIRQADALVSRALEGLEDPPADPEEAVSRVYEAAVGQGKEYTFVERNPGSVVLGMPSGGAYVYLPDAPDNGVDDANLADISSALLQGVGAGGRILTVDTSLSECRISNPIQSAYTDAAAQGIADALSAYIFDARGTADDDDRNETEASLDFLKSLSAYSVVVWHGHGGFSAGIGSFLCTAVPEHARWRADYRAGRLVMCSNGCYGVTPAFFEQYLAVNPHAESLIYLGTCSSGNDARLANAFLEKGFDCVIANNGVILRTYNYNMLRRFFAGMSGSDGAFLTAGQALNGARAQYGAQDKVYDSIPTLFGDENVCFGRGQVKSASPVPTHMPTPTRMPIDTLAPTGTPSVTPKPTPTTVPAPEPTPVPTAAPQKPVDRGTDDRDYEERAYVDETIKHYNGSNAPYTLPMNLDRMAACIIRDCTETGGARTITVDYAAWEWFGNDGVPTLGYRNDSSRTYMLPVADDVLISIFSPDRSEYPSWDESDEMSGFYAPSDWRTLCRCYDQITDPGTSWAQPTYFFLHFDNEGRVDCIWQDMLFFTNN